MKMVQCKSYNSSLSNFPSQASETGENGCSGEKVINVSAYPFTTMKVNKSGRFAVACASLASIL